MPLHIETKKLPNKEAAFTKKAASGSSFNAASFPIREEPRCEATWAGILTSVCNGYSCGTVLDLHQLPPLRLGHPDHKPPCCLGLLVYESNYNTAATCWLVGS